MNDVGLHDAMLEVAVEAARAAGEIVRARFEGGGGALAVSEKSPRDFVTDVDRACEEAILSRIRRAFPRHGILSEESAPGGALGGGGGPVWVVDPLDGTTNFIHGFPAVSVSVGACEGGRSVVGCVFDPLRGECFSARRGGGAFVNGRPLSVRSCPDVAGALVGTGFPVRIQPVFEAYLETLRGVYAGVAGVRRCGSAALDLAYVAAGRLDGFWEVGLHAWDMAAGVLLIEEAGGVVTDFLGARGFLASGRIVCGGPDVHRFLLSRVAGFPENGGGA